MNRSLPQIIEAFTDAKLCLADWQRAAGIHFGDIRPLLEKEIGELSKSYPTDVHPIRYTIGIRDDRPMGFVSDEYGVMGIEDRWLDEDDIQIWSLDPDKVAAYLGPLNAPQIADKPVVKVYNDFEIIVLPNGRSVEFGRKYKRRAFLRAVVQYCRDHSTDLIPAQTVINDYNATLPKGEDSPKAIRTSDVVYELFKGQSDVFKDLFEIRDVSAAIFRLKVTFEAA